jgi:hypothetical protein
MSGASREGDLMSTPHEIINHQGWVGARAGMLVEAAWSAARTPGPLRAFYQGVANRRGVQVAVVATARKLVVVCWHLVNSGQDYAYVRPSLVTRKRRTLELRAGALSACGYGVKPRALRRRRSVMPSVICVHRPRSRFGGWSPRGSPLGPLSERRCARPVP